MPKITKKKCQKWQWNTKIYCNLTPIVFGNLRSIKHTWYLPKTVQKLAKNCQKRPKNKKKCHKRMILHSKMCPLEMIFFVCFPAHFLGLSKRYVLDPQTLIGDSVFMEIWLKQNRPFHNFRQKYQFFHRSRYDQSDRSKLRQNQASYEKNW